MFLQPIFQVLARPLPKKTLQSFRRDAGWSANPERAPSGLPPGGKVQWVALEQDKERIGICRLELAAPQFCYVSELIIATGYRRQGFGRRFVKFIEQYCAQQHIERLLLWPAENTRGFYDSLYFIPDPKASGFLKKELNPFQRKFLGAQAAFGLR